MLVLSAGKVMCKRPPRKHLVAPFAVPIKRTHWQRCYCLHDTRLVLYISVQGRPIRDFVKTIFD